jgi:hypothetical protein
MVMTHVTALWLPILLSAILVFVVSSIIHMAPLWHKNDYPKLPDEEKTMDALRPLNIPAGDYMMPRCTSMEEMKSPEFMEKMKRGPVVVMTVMPPPNGMASNLGQWFAFVVVVSFAVACLAAGALPPGSSYPKVFHLVAVGSFMAYAMAIWPMSIWYHRAWSSALKGTLDGVIFALLTAGVFGWLWPK